ncbi:hypothetical protein A6770_26590 [Nostoc minutum NIES-26]|uniref:Low-complexity protein n=1 Tax=Nostoc minutum NIES-26 TaxID=1844469 RepID=A0A367QS99_9NOSO|nr:hypothetical protein A6770_26590 [Nostoc minutum NIES-26]
MVDHKHLAVLKQGVNYWNDWRQNNPDVIPDLSKVDLKGIDLKRINLRGANLSKTDFTGAYLRDADFRRANFYETLFDNANLNRTNFSVTKLSGASLNEANFMEANFIEADFSGCQFYKANFSKANFSKAKLKVDKIAKLNFTQAILIEANLSEADLRESNFCEADLRESNLSRANLEESNLSRADFSQADLSGSNLARTQALSTQFQQAILTGACLEDWNINSDTEFSNVICDYIYLRRNRRERRPSSGNFATGEFTLLFQKTLETIDLIFRDGINWDAFAYSFNRVEIANINLQLDVQSIEKKKNEIILVRVSVASDADKAKIYNDFIQGYEFAHKILEEQYEVKLKEKDILVADREGQIVKYEKQINRLLDIVVQQGSVQKALVEHPRKVSNYDLRNSLIAGGIIDAETVQSNQIGGSIQNPDTQENPS